MSFNSNNQNLGGGNMGGPPTGDPNDFYRSFEQYSGVVNQVVRSDLINNLYEKQKEKYAPGASWLWDTLKIYFAVNNSFVFSKLKLILVPFLNKEGWQRKIADDMSDNSESNGKFSLPRADVNSPDLYIPFMSFITYVLLIGLASGLSNSEKFSPNALIQSIWRLAILQSIESLVIKFGFSMIGYNIMFLDTFAYTGYKYVGLGLTIVSKLFGSVFTSLTALYTSIAFAFFFLKTLSPVVSN
jgi:hypothetical protein